MSKEVKLNIQASGPEVIIREGTAPKIYEPQALKTSGTIKSIGEFLSKRKQNPGEGQQAVDPGKAVVLVDRKEMSIVLFLDPTSILGTEIKGIIEPSEELAVFCINTQKTFTRDELVRLLRFNRSAFLDLDKHTQLLAAYQAFKANMKSEMDAASDTRGNKKFGFQKDVTTNLPDQFVLSVPIFKGEKPVNFRVEICLEVTDGGARFWFESVELKEAQDELRDQLIDEQLQFCTDFPVIEK